VSPVRRVQIGDDGPRPDWDQPEPDDYEADRLRADEDVLSVEQYDAEERQRSVADERDVLREWVELEPHEHDAEPLRKRDLEPVEEIVRKARPLTEAQRRAQTTWGDVPRDAVPRRDQFNEDGHEMAPWQPGDDQRSDETAKYLRESDPDYKRQASASELAAEVSLRLARTFYFALGDKATVGISREDVLVAFAPGKPNARRRVLRRALREALCDLYADGSRHDLLAADLGCSRQALHTLMRKP